MRYKEEVETVYKIFKEIHLLEKNKKYREGIERLTKLIPAIRDAGLRIEAISYRADIYEIMGNYESAKRDFLYCLRLIKKDNYNKYTIEIEMGIICEKENNKTEALSWYLKALSTGIKAKISGGWGLDRFLKIKGANQLSKEERILCTKVVRISWAALQLPGEPDLSNLSQTAKYLLKAESTQRIKEN